MNTRSIFLAALTALSLGACSTVNGLGTDLSDLFGSKGKTTTEKTPDTGMSTDGQNWVDAQGKPMAPPSDKMNLSYDRRASELASGSVEMYSLDGPSSTRITPATDDRTAGTGSYGYEGVPASTDSSVTVFPFSDDMYTPGVKPGVGGYGRKPAPGFDARGDGMMPMYTGNPTVVYFANGSSALSQAASKALAQVARQYHGGLLRVDGHASRRTAVKDPIKAALVNFEISMKRSMAVTRRLMARGVPPQAIRVGAYGDTEPAVPETSRAAEAKNRRVEIHGAAQ